ncbi:MAG: hypothetical protein ACRD1W_20075, partial [Vicinamibacterales bacterium]
MSKTGAITDNPEVTLSSSPCWLLCDGAVTKYGDALVTDRPVPAAAGDPDIKTKLLKGIPLGKKTGLDESRRKGWTVV